MPRLQNSFLGRTWQSVTMFSQIWLQNVASNNHELICDIDHRGELCQNEMVLAATCVRITYSRNSSDLWISGNVSVLLIKSERYRSVKVLHFYSIIFVVTCSENPPCTSMRRVSSFGINSRTMITDSIIRRALVAKFWLINTAWQHVKERNTGFCQSVIPIICRIWVVLSILRWSVWMWPGLNSGAYSGIRFACPFCR